MTTRVIVEVPDHVDYTVTIKTSDGQERTVAAGARTELHIYEGVSVTNIEEVRVAK